MATDRSVLIIIPAYAGWDDLLAHRIAEARFPCRILIGHSDLPRARSALIGMALAARAERVILLDADTVPEAGVLERLADSPLVTPERAVWGLYVHRDGTRWCLEPEDPAVAVAAIAAGERFPLERGGLGIACVHRASLLRVLETLPAIEEENGARWWPFCVPLVRPRGDGTADYFADDGSLCVRLRDTGTALVCDPTLRAAHAVGGQWLTAPRAP